MQRLLSTLLLFLLIVSCNPLSAVKELLFEGDKKQETKKTTPPVPVETAIEVEKETPEGRTAPQKPPPLPLKAKTSLPLTPVDHFGGSPTSLNGDDRYLYAGFGRKLVFFDHELNRQGFVNLERMPIEVTSRAGEDTLVLYVKEVGDVLEIVSLPKGKGPEILKSFQVDGPFDFSTSPLQLHVYLKDRVQVLDLLKPNEVNVLFEIPIPGVKQVFPLGDYLYLVEGTHLTVLGQKNLSVLSSLSLETDFKILGSRKEGETDRLILALQSSKTGKTRAIHFISLNSSEGQLADLGQGIELKAEADGVLFDEEAPFLYLVRGEKLGLFDLESRSELEAPELPPLQKVESFKKTLFVASRDLLGIFELVASPTAPATQWARKKTIPIPESVDRVLLLDSKTVLVTSGGSSLFFSDTFSTDTSGLRPLSLPQSGSVEFTLAKVSQSGVFLYDSKSKQIYLVKKDLSAVVTVNISPQEIVGMDAGFDGKNDLLTLVIKGDEGAGDASVIYTVESPEVVKNGVSFPLKEGGGIGLFENGKKALVACGREGVCLLDFSDPAAVKLLATVKPPQEGAAAREVLLSPQKKIAYVYFESEGGGVSISVLDLSQPTPAEISVIKDVFLSPHQFRGATFSAGGQRLLLPHQKGLQVFDVADARTPTLLFDWNVGEVFYADVANRGLTVCAALGEAGVECATFSQ